LFVAEPLNDPRIMWCDQLAVVAPPLGLVLGRYPESMKMVLSVPLPVLLACHAASPWWQAVAPKLGALGVSAVGAGQRQLKQTATQRVVGMKAVRKR
jgi:hypothetical protein